MTLETQARQCFLEQYRQVRHAEGRGSPDPAYYRALPYEDLSGKNSSMWAMRARTYRYLENKLLPKWERSAGTPLDILDLGAGNCWMSYRLALRNHRVTALDIFDDPLDGLRAAGSYPVSIPTIEGEFNALPCAADSFDLVIYNAAIHYSTDYFETLREAQRCLRPSGHVVILDSPIYRTHEHGARMVSRAKAGVPARSMGSLPMRWRVSNFSISQRCASCRKNSDSNGGCIGLGTGCGGTSGLSRPCFKDAGRRQTFGFLWGVSRAP